jgi:predicted DNA-binding protein YlxM (UPF0122 family)
MQMLQTVGKSHDTKDSFYDKIERVLEQLPKYHMKILLKESSQRLGRNTFQTDRLELDIRWN